MKSYKLISPKNFELEENTIATSPIDNNQLKIKIEMSAISSTDYQTYSGSSNTQMPIILGRHGVGFVSEVFSEEYSSFSKGDPVVINPFLPCGECYFCKTNNPSMCENIKIMGISRDGLYRDFITLPSDAVYKLPETLSFENALYTEYVALAVTVLDKLNVEKGDHVAIMSSGKLGLIAAQLVTYYQAIPILIDTNSQSLADGKSLGVYYAFDQNNPDIFNTIFSITGGRMCEKVLFPSNSAADITDAINFCSINGKICLMGFMSGKSIGDFGAVHQKHLTIFSATNGRENYSTAINLLATKTVNVSSLSSKTITFDDIPQTFTELDYEDLRYKDIHIKI